MGNKFTFNKLIVAFLLIWVLFPNAVFAQYCAPQYAYGCVGNFPTPIADFINNFSTTNGVTNITNNNTGCNGQPNNFIYNAGMTVSVAQGCSFGVSMQSGNTYAQGYAIWIDWNSDLDYNDAGELVYSSPNFGTNQFTGTIQVPASASVGLKRMRVRCCYSIVPSNPCSLQGTFQVGEVEEYNVDVLPNTLSSITASNQTICAGTSATLTANSTGVVKWYINATSNAVINNGATFVTPVLNTTTTYYVQATLGSCTTPRVPVVVTVIPPLSITASASQTSVCPGSLFNLSSNGGSGLIYNWEPASAVSDATLNSPSATISAASTFTVTATDANGCSGTASVSVDVLPAATLSISATSNDFCEGGTSTLSVSGGSSYTWSPAATLSSATGNSVTASPTSTTNYIVTSPGSSTACAASANVTITVHPTPIVDAGIPLAFCAGGNVNLSASGATTYSWTPTSDLSSSTISNPIASPNNTTTYTVTGTSAFGCIASDEVEVTVNQLPTANPGLGDSHCFGESTQLTGSGGTSYQWSPATGLSDAAVSNPVASPNLTTSYSLIVTDNNGCISSPSVSIAVTVNQLPAAPVVSNSGALSFCAGNDVTLSAAGGQSYSWSNGSTSSSINVDASGTFSVSITDVNGCQSPSSLPVSVNVNPIPAAPIITSIGSTTFCQGGNATLQANQASGILWNNAAASSSITVSTTGQYTAQYTDVNGCESPESSPVQVNVTPLAATPSISASGPTEFCEGNSVVLTASHGENFIWSNGETSQSILVNESGTYTVTISSVCPPLNPTNELEVKVRPIPTPTITANIRKDCLPVEIQFSFSTNGIGPFNYSWLFGDGNTSSSPQPIHEYTEDGIYDISLQLTDVIGCTGDSTEVDFIEILERPNVAFSVNPSITTLSNPEIQLISQTSGGQNETWTVEPLGTFIGDTVIVSMPDTGTYFVDFAVITEQGCEAIIRKDIQVVEDFQIYVPTGFTPNNDGINDTFKPICTGYKLKGFEFRIFNRFGQEIFYSDNPEIGWDAQNIQSDIYTWKMIVRSLLNEDKLLNGTITLFR
jgi:gliding motility-associated-like protein